jgi:hypothetical protein
MESIQRAMGATELFVYPDTCARPRVFSNINHPFNDIFYDKFYEEGKEGKEGREGKKGRRETVEQVKLQRQTNNWQLEFGEHPEYYAVISDGDSIDRHIVNDAIAISTLVQSELIALPGPAHKYKDLKSRVVRYIVRATEQLNQLRDAGEITFTKLGNKRIIHILSTFEMVSIEFLLCDFTGYMYTVLSQNNWIVNGRPSYPSLDTPAIQSLISILRDVLDNKQRHFYRTIETEPRMEEAQLRFRRTPRLQVPFPNEVDGIVTHALGEFDHKSDVVYASNILDQLSLAIPEVQDDDEPPSLPKLTRELSTTEVPVWRTPEQRYNASSLSRYDRLLKEMNEKDLKEISEISEKITQRTLKPLEAIDPGAKFWEKKVKPTDEFWENYIFGGGPILKGLGTNVYPDSNKVVLNEPTGPQLTRLRAPPAFAHLSAEENAARIQADNEYYAKRFKMPPIIWNMSRDAQHTQDAQDTQIREVRVCDFCNEMATVFREKELCNECAKLTEFSLISEEEFEQEPAFKKKN